ncbi:MAG: nitrogenase cofactor biosynthesis protein NifB [Pseudomonadota bacterium]
MINALNRAAHPCFNRAAEKFHGRVHLPVAPKCNILCNYCLRKYDCVNESRPGVTSRVLTPDQALAYLDLALEKEPRLSVAGIAGPGDPLANPDRTMAVLRGVRRAHPGLILCLATNGLALPARLDELAESGVTHVTVTVNAVAPEVGARIYRWVRDDGVIYQGKEAARRLLERQVLGIAGLKERGVTVKINTIVIPGINDHHITEISRLARDLGADIQNLTPLFPTAGTPLADVPEPSPEFIGVLRNEAGRYIDQMTHCRRCRADAVGLLEQDRSRDFLGLMSRAAGAGLPAGDRPFVAVATLEGQLINQHLGEASRLQVWTMTPAGPALVQDRAVPEPGSGDDRWVELAARFRDCRAVLVKALGDRPRQVLEKHGLSALEMDCFIREGVEAVFLNRPDLLRFAVKKQGGRGGGCCSGSGEGC